MNKSLARTRGLAMMSNMSYSRPKYESLARILGLETMSNMSYSRQKYERPYESKAQEKARKARRALKDKSENKNNKPWI